MSTTNVEIINQLYESFGRGDIPSILNRLADNIDWCQSGPQNIFPFAGPRCGKEEMIRNFKAIVQSLDIQAFEPREFIVHADRVIVFGYEMGSVRSTGRKYEFDWIHVFTLNDGKVSKYRDFYDTTVLAQAFSTVS